MKNFDEMLNSLINDDDDEIIEIEKIDLRYHPGYYSNAALEMIDNAELKKEILKLKEKNSIRKKNSPKSRKVDLETLEINLKEKEKILEIEKEWRTNNTKFAKKEKKRGRPITHTQDDIDAIKACYIPWSFGFTRIAKMLSGLGSPQDYKLLFLFLDRAGWDAEKIKYYYGRVLRGEAKMSHTQAKRLYDNN